MNKAKNRKRWIEYALKKSSDDPLNALRLLSNSYYEIPLWNKQARHKLLQEILTLRSNYTNSIWQKHKRQIGEDIPALTLANLHLWQQRASEHYSIETIKRLRKAWYQYVVPQLMLNHVSRDLVSIRHQAAVKSNNVRLQSGQTVNNSHTRGSKDVRRDYAYFTLALEAMSPDYWRDKPELIQVQCLKACKADTAPMMGLWIGSHHWTGSLATKYFDDCQRTVFYEEKQRRTRYVYPDGQTKEVLINRDEEIFCAARDPNDIFDGLFLQIIVDIAHIGDPFLARLLDPSSTATILAAFFQYAYSPSTYPEAKLCGQLDLRPEYVKTFDHYGPAPHDIVEFFQAIQLGNRNKLSAMLARDPGLCKATTEKDTVLTAILRSRSSIKDDSRCLSMLDCLTQHGVDPDYDARVGKNILDAALDLGESYRPFSHSLIDGIPVPSHPYIRLAIKFYTPPTVMMRVIQNRHVDILQKLIARGITATNTNLILYYLYHYDTQLTIQDRTMTKEETVHWFIETFHIDIHDNNFSSPLLHYAMRHNTAFMQWWLRTFPQYDINVTDGSGNTALHTAILYRVSATVITALLDAGIDTQRVNQKGQTAYSLANDLAHANAATLRYYSELSGSGQDRLLAIQSTPDEFVTTLRQRYQEYCKLLQARTGETEQTAPYPQTTIQAAERHVKSASAMVIALSDEGPVVLFVRKKGSDGSEIGPFLFPGGFCDATDRTPVHTAERELLEETGLQQTVVEWLTTGCLVETTYYQHTFALANLNKLPPQHLSATDDVACTCWIPWRKIIVKQTQFGQHFYYDGIPIEPSNAEAVRLTLLQCADKTSCEQIWQNKQNAETALYQHYKNNDLPAFISVVKRDYILLTNAYWLFNAIQHARENWLLPLLECGTPLNQMISSSSLVKTTVLIRAIERGAYATAHTLIRAGANVNLSAESLSPLSASIRPLNDENAKVFLDELLTQYQIDLGQEVGLKALARAIEIDNSWAFARILAADRKKAIDLNRSFTSGWNSINLLALACHSVNLAMVQMLLAHGVKPIFDQDSRVFQTLFAEAGRHSLRNALPRYKGCDQPENPDRLMQYLSLFRSHTEEQLKLSQFRQLLKIWQALTGNNPHIDYGIANIKPESSNVFKIYRRITDGETYFLFVQTRPSGITPPQFDSPYILPLEKETVVNQLVMNPQLFEILNGMTIDTTTAKVLTNIFIICDNFSYEENRHVLIDTNETSPEKLVLCSGHTSQWIKWSEVSKTSSNPAQSYFQYQGNTIAQADACLCELVHLGSALEPKQDDIQELLYEKRLGTAYLTEAYNNKDAPRLIHLIKAGVVNLNDRHDSASTGKYITLPEFDQRYNRGLFQECFTTARRTDALVVVANNDSNNNNTNDAVLISATSK